MGTFAGVSMYKNGAWETLTVKEGLTCNCTFALCVDSNNGYWIGTADGLNYYNGDSIVTYTADDVLCEGFVHALGIDKNGILWVGTSDGLMSYNGILWKTYRDSQGLVDNYINEITPHNDGSVWIGTMNGVSVYKDGVFSNINPGNELVSSRVYAIAFDHEDRVWIGGYGGISVYSIQGNDIIPEYTKHVHHNKAEIAYGSGNVYVMITCAVPQNILVQIYSLHGRMLRSKHAGLLTEGTHSIPLNSKSLGTGRYILKISGEKTGSQHLLFNILEL
jgi:ligand-binding sensor domain-containing protein